MEIKCIKSNNRYFKEIINHYYNWFANKKSKTIEEYENTYLNSFNEEKLPNQYALIINDILIGMYEINEKDNIENKKYTPYLANVYIKEEYRNNGYSKFLIEDAKEKARKLGYKELYLHSRIENYYEKFDFKFIEEVETNQGTKRIFKIKL